MNSAETLVFKVRQLHCEAFLNDNALRHSVTCARVLAKTMSGIVTIRP